MYGLHSFHKFRGKIKEYAVKLLSQKFHIFVTFTFLALACLDIYLR